jgi:hypothetical protein
MLFKMLFEMVNSMQPIRVIIIILSKETTRKEMVVDNLDHHEEVTGPNRKTTEGKILKADMIWIIRIRETRIQTPSLRST